MKLWLVRHAVPLVEPGVCYGRTDLAADAGQTLALAHELALDLPPRIALASSPARRCADLAGQLLALRPDLSLSIDERLQEFDFGAWEGRPWSDIGPAELDAWRDGFADHAPGGGESVRALMNRVADAFERRPEQAVWLTHAGVIRAVRLLQAGVRCPASASDWPAEAIAYGETLFIEG